jgi:hypothetical protein
MHALWGQVYRAGRTTVVLDFPALKLFVELRCSDLTDGFGWLDLGSWADIELNRLYRGIGAWIRPDCVAEAIVIIVHNKSLFNMTSDAWRVLLHFRLARA